MPTLLKSLGISSPEEAAELEHDLGFRFSDLTHQQRETWKKQTVYLGLYAENRSSTHAASAAGVTVRTVRNWHTQDTLGFNDRLQFAVLQYNEEIDQLLLRQARKPDCSPSLLMMFARAQVPEKYGPARRDSARPITRCEHDDHPNPAPHEGDTSHSNLSPTGGEIQRGGSSPSPVLGEGWGEGPAEGQHPDLPHAAADSKPAHDPSPHEGDTSHSNLSPAGGEIQRGGSSPSPVLGEGRGEGQGGGRGESNPPAPSTQHLNPSHAAADPKPAPDIAPAPQNPTPPLNRRQRRQLQRQQRKHRTKQPTSNHPRAPT